MHDGCVGKYCITCATQVAKLISESNMKNKDKIQQIIDQQLDKIATLSTNGKMPLAKQDIDSLVALAKLVIDSDQLERKEKNKMDELSDEELLLIHKHRSKK